MKQKLLMMLAALMLMGTSAMAQSETLKGDVNGDGAVDVADIAAVIQIMKDNGDIETKYYWYAGWTIPTAENIAEIINEEYPVSSTNSTTHKAGGSTTVITGYTKDNPLYYYDASENRYNSAAKTNYYLVLPNGIGVYGPDGANSLLDKYTEQTSISIPNHKVYKSNTTTRNIAGLLLF